MSLAKCFIYHFENKEFVHASQVIDQQIYSTWFSGVYTIYKLVCLELFLC